MVDQGCAVRVLRGGQFPLQGEQSVFEHSFQFGHGLFLHYSPGVLLARRSRMGDFPAFRRQQIILALRVIRLQPLEHGPNPDALGVIPPEKSSV